MAAMRVSNRAAVLAVVGAPVVPVGLAELVAQVVLAARGAQEALAELAVQVAREAPAGLVVPVALVVPENPVVPEDPVALVVPENPVVPEDPVALGVPEKPVAPELETVPAVEALVLGQVAAPVKIKSVTAAHHHGQVRVPKRVEDLAVVAAETMRAQAATEAAKAWAAAE
jgi:hypothetical protein